MARQYIINGQEFSTQKELKQYVRRILYKYRLRENLSIDDLAFMKDLLMRHENAKKKIGCGIQSMHIRRNKPFNNRGFWIVRVDGTETDFSYIMCLRKESRLQKFKSACREAVSRGIMKYKSEFFRSLEPKVCPITNQAISIKSSHVDHKPPNTFDKIVTGFIEDYDIDVEKVKISGIGEDGNLRNRIGDTTLREEFIQYHNRKVDLRVISAEANLSSKKSAKDEQLDLF